MLTDVAGFGVLLGMHLASFLVIQWLVARFLVRRHLLPVSTGVALVTAGAVSIAGWFTLPAFFSSKEALVLALVGSATTSLFAAGLYSFLGPITADRSCASQMLQFFVDSGRGLSREAIQHAFDADGFVDKRIVECLDGGLIRDEGGVFVLTPRGQRLAAVYRFLSSLLALESMSEYRPYFREPGPGKPPDVS